MYPVFPQPRAAGASCSSVAGRVAAGKLEGLLAAGAQVTVVAPEIRPELEQRRRRDRAAARSRTATSTGLVGGGGGAAGCQPAGARWPPSAGSVFVNAVDDPPHATAYLGGVVRRDGVTIAISTDGRAPALAGLLREALDAWLPARSRRVDGGGRRGAAQRGSRTACRWNGAGRMLLETLNRLYEGRNTQPVRELRMVVSSELGVWALGVELSQGRVSLVGAGPGDPELWTVRALQRVQEADLVLYDALVDAECAAAADERAVFLRRQARRPRQRASRRRSTG